MLTLRRVILSNTINTRFFSQSIQIKAFRERISFSYAAFARDEMMIFAKCDDQNLNVKKSSSFDLMSLNLTRFAQLHVLIVRTFDENVLHIRVQCVRKKL